MIMEDVRNPARKVSAAGMFAERTGRVPLQQGCELSERSGRRSDRLAIFREYELLPADDVKVEILFPMPYMCSEARQQPESLKLSVFCRKNSLIRGQRSENNHSSLVHVHVLHHLAQGLHFMDIGESLCNDNVDGTTNVRM